MCVCVCVCVGKKILLSDTINNVYGTVYTVYNSILPQVAIATKSPACQPNSLVILHGHIPENSRVSRYSADGTLNIPISPPHRHPPNGTQLLH